MPPVVGWGRGWQEGIAGQTGLQVGAGGREVATKKRDGAHSRLGLQHEAGLVLALPQIQKDLHETTLKDVPDGVSVRDEFFLKWRNILGYFLENPLEAHFLEQYASSPYVRPQVAEEIRRRNAHLRHLRQRGIDQGIIRPVKYQTLVIFLWGSVKELSRQSASGDLAITDGLVEELFSVFWEGIRAR